MDENIVLHDKEDIVEELEKLGMDIIANKDLPIPIKGGKFLLNVSMILGLRHLFSYSFMIIAKKNSIQNLLNIIYLLSGTFIITSRDYLCQQAYGYELNSNDYEQNCEQ